MIDSVEITTAILGFRPLPQSFLWTRHGRKPQNCRWDFDAICHSSRDISISGLGGYIAISGCRSMLLSFGDTFFDVVVVGKLDFVILELQQYFSRTCFVILVNHVHKISPFKKKLCTCLMSCQTTSGARIGDWIVAFCTHFIFRKSHESTAPNAEQNCFTDSKTELGAFFLPQAQYEC